MLILLWWIHVHTHTLRHACWVHVPTVLCKQPCNIVPPCHTGHLALPHCTGPVSCSLPHICGHCVPRKGQLSK